MIIVIDVHGARDADEARDWLHEATENFDIAWEYLGAPLPQYEPLLPYIMGKEDTSV